MTTKEEEQEEIEKQTRAFLNSGGMINQIPIGVSGVYDPYVEGKPVNNKQRYYRGYPDKAGVTT